MLLMYNLIPNYYPFGCLFIYSIAYSVYPFDFRGRTPDWYNKAFGHLCAAEAARVRNSFQPLITEGPETKI